MKPLKKGATYDDLRNVVNEAALVAALTYWGVALLH